MTGCKMAGALYITESNNVSDSAENATTTNGVKDFKVIENEGIDDVSDEKRRQDKYFDSERNDTKRISHTSSASFEDNEPNDLSVSTTTTTSKRNSLDRLKDLPHGSPNSTTENSSSTTSNHFKGSTISRLSFNSSESMPSLSSIMEHDLSSVANTTVGAMSETSSIATCRSMYSNHTTASDGSSLGVALNNAENMFTARNQRLPAVFDQPGNPRQRDIGSTKIKVQAHLEGETVDCLGPTLSNKPRRLSQERWESDAVCKTSRIAKIAPGNPDVAPLTHAQKMLLPPRQDVQLDPPSREDTQPVYVARRESDTSSSTVTSNSANKLPKAIRQQQKQQEQHLQRHPLLRSNSNGLGRLVEDSIPVVASRHTSSSSLLEIPFLVSPTLLRTSCMSDITQSGGRRNSDLKSNLIGNSLNKMNGSNGVVKLPSAPFSM